MANLIIDIGNTALKASWADGITLGKTFRYQGERMIEFIFSLLEKEKPEVMVISSARNFSNQNITRLKQMCDRLVIVDNEILEHYSLPDCLTPDRAASIIAAKYLFKGRGCTIFDFGTTMSIDFISKEGEYEGGNISVGCRTRFKALNRYTKNLPLVENPFEIEISGKNIQSSIASGVITGIMFEIEGYLGRYPENVAVFTGGDAIYFAKRMKNSIFVVCNLVLMGLALIAFGQKELCPEV
ncbi:MAG: type III pantothenate kinase [Bacteroidales bacterium]|nr:type III pantothenate kinase [Bacteroidales bacterium]MDD5891616.1 type III pantothenate kinase [Bacteroidales bacterium]MDY5357427.1 type III pantothenate kinase [Candidatus Cryptobacteroides sp.]